MDCTVDTGMKVYMYRGGVGNVDTVRTVYRYRGGLETVGIVDTGQFIEIMVG